jgi:hypothetical protein
LRACSLVCVFLYSDDEFYFFSFCDVVVIIVVVVADRCANDS